MDFDFLKIERNDLEPGKSRILISEPFSQDSFFKRSVVFLTEHNSEGSIGFILNKPVDIPASELLKDFPDIDAVVSIGGPVQTDTIHYLHTLGDVIPNSLHVANGIYWGGQLDQIRLMAEAGMIKRNQLRFFIGYSGWAPKQLNEELEENFWLVADSTKEAIFDLPFETTWEDTLSKMEDKYKIWTNFPENPELN